MRQYLKEIGLHSAVYTISNVLTKAIGIILIPIYTRYLTVEDYGIISIITPLITTFMVFYRFGMRSAYGRFFFDQADKSTAQKKLLGNIVVFIMSFGLLINLLLTFFGKPLFVTLFPGVDFYPYIILAIWTSFLLLAFDLKQNIFRLRKQSLRYGIYSLVKFLLIVSLTIYTVVVLKMGALGKVFSEFIVCFAFFVLSFILLIKDMVFSFDITKFKELLKYALPVLPHNIAGVILGLTAKYFLNLNEGTGAAGIYNIAFLIGSVMNIIITSINLSWNPFFMKTAKENEPDKAKEIFSRLTTYYTMTIIFIGMAVIVFSKEIIMLLTTPDYYGAIIIAPFIILSYVIRGGYYVVVAKIFYVKKATKYLAYITVSSAIINIILNAVMVPVWGMLGSAIAFIITSVFLFGFTYLSSQRVYYIRYEYKRLLMLGVISSICFVIYIAIFSASLSFWIELLLKIGVLFLYLALLFVFRFLSKSEVESLKNIALKMKKKYLPSNKS